MTANSLRSGSRSPRSDTAYSTASPAFRKALALFGAIGVLWATLALGGALPLAIALAASAAFLLHTQATKLLVVFVAFMPVFLFLTGVVGAVVR